MPISIAMRRGTQLPAAALWCLFATSLAAQTAWTAIPVGPGPRSDTAAVFDPVRRQFLLHGGWNGVANLDETWVLDGSGWSQQAPFPGLVSSHRLAFLPSQAVVVAFGGWNGTTMSNGTFAWDGSQWAARSPANAPSPRFSHMMCSDTARGVIVLFGGYCGTGCALDDTWEYDGVDWTLRNPAVRPSGRFSAGMAFDGARNHTLLFGGRALAGRVNDTWTWNGSNWSARGSGGPSPRSTPVLEYDPRRERIVLFGGFVGTYSAETWEHDGNLWQQRTAANPPAGRGFAAMAFDGNRMAMVLVGGETPAGITGAAHAYGPVSPATVQDLGLGCGGITLTARGLPWLGDTFRLVAEGLAPGAPAALFGLGLSNSLWGAATLPIDLSAQGMPGCQLGVAWDASQLATAVGSRAEHGVTIPNVAALLGVAFSAQVLGADRAVVPAGVGMSTVVRSQVGAR